MKLQTLDSLIYNPIWTSELLHYFISGATDSVNKKVKFELLYLALPFIYDNKLLGKLSSSTTRSTFSTLFAEAELRNCLIGMDSKITSFTQVTNQALVLIGKKVSVDDGYIQAVNAISYKTSKKNLRDHYKAAYNLGAIFSKDDYREIFLKIGASA